MFNKIVDSTTALSTLNDNCVVAISGFNLATTPEYLILELYNRHLELGHPKNIFIVSDALPATPGRGLDYIAEKLYKDAKSELSTRSSDALPGLFAMVSEASNR